MEPIPVNVLVVEDEEKIRKLNRKSVERCSNDQYKFLVDEAQDGLEALNKVKNEHYHIILLDITLDKHLDHSETDRKASQENGLAFLEEIREHYRSPKVIIYTRHTGLDEDAHGYLMKAIDLHSFGLISKKDSPDKQEEKLKKFLQESVEDLFEFPPDLSDVYQESDLSILTDEDE